MKQHNEKPSSSSAFLVEEGCRKNYLIENTLSVTHIYNGTKVQYINRTTVHIPDWVFQLCLASLPLTPLAHLTDFTLPDVLHLSAVFVLSCFLCFSDSLLTIPYQLLMISAYVQQSVCCFQPLHVFLFQLWLTVCFLPQ